MFADDCQIYLSFSPNEVAQVVEGFNTDSLQSVELFGLRELAEIECLKTQMICMRTSREVYISVKPYVNSNPINLWVLPCYFKKVSEAWEWDTSYE
jgi:hypothetical protein